MGLKKLLLICVIQRNKQKHNKQININTTYKMQNGFDVHYLYGHTNCSLVGFQETQTQSKMGQRQRGQFGN